MEVHMVVIQAQPVQFTWSGIGPLSYKQACTLIKIISWVCKHEDCDVTEEEGMDLCTAIQYLSNTRPKDKEVEG